jgi:hypothetical protein
LKALPDNNSEVYKSKYILQQLLIVISNNRGYNLPSSLKIPLSYTWSAESGFYHYQIETRARVSEIERRTVAAGRFILARTYATALCIVAISWKW